MKIFLTGSGGMLGRNILSHPESDKYNWLTPARSELDLLNFTDVNNFIKKEKPEFIIHAAGKVGGINSHLNNQFNFFYENLLDADIASNTLSWRWVAGLQTLGKKYIATKENITPSTSYSIITFIMH